MPLITRRDFARNAALSLLAAPFVQLLQGDAKAQATGFAKRLIVFFTPNGTVHRFWRPQGEGTEFSFPEGSILEPLSHLRDDLLVLSGLNFFGVSNHDAGMAAMLTGGHSERSVTAGMSVDQWIARQLPAESPFRSLEFGVLTSIWGGSQQTRISYSGPGQYVPPNDDPLNAYQRMFGNVGAEDAELQRALRRKQSVLDLVSGELRSLRDALGGVERAKLDQHLQALREVELSVQRPGVDCAAPQAGGPIAVGAHENFPEIGRRQTDLMITALACGLTRVASLQWSHTVSPIVFSWLGQREAHHGLSHIDDHNPAGLQRFVAAERWFAEQFAYLVERLKDIPEPDGEGSMLDNTLVLWAKELGDSRLHNCVSVPFLMAGAAGGFLRPGRHLALGSVPHQKLLVSVCHAMGLNNPTFGDPAHGTGGLEGLS